MVEVHADPLPTLAAALDTLAAIDGISILGAPDLMTLARSDLALATRLQLALIEHCETLADRVSILDPPPGLTPDALLQWRESTGYDSSHAVLYAPWLEAIDPATGAAAAVPPCGHVAGTWARSDAGAGVHRAPSNLTLFGVSAPECSLDAREEDELVLRRVNLIRPIGRRGIRVWGARTLSSDPEWRYVNVRRLCIYLESSIAAGIQWAVFEPNGELLWERLQAQVYDFLKETWRAGMLCGRRPQEAFYVRCNAETNRQDDSGTVTVEVGVAPASPAEFLVFRVTLSTVAGCARPRG